MGKTKSTDSFPMFSADFLIGVAGMKDADVGQYIKLLCLQHQKGHLTEDEYKTFSPKLNPGVLNKFKTDEDGKYYNPVLDEVLKRREKFKEKQSQNAAKRKPNGSQNGAKVLPECYQDEAKNEPLIDSEHNIKISDYRAIIPPSIKIVELYCKLRKNKIDARYFMDYYNARGWVYGKQETPIVDWQAMIRTWEKNEKKNSGVNLNELNDEKNRYKR